MHDADLVAYLEGLDISGGAALDADTRAALDATRETLGQADVWAEPDASLEASVRAAVRAAAPASATRSRWRRARVVTAAAAAMVAAALIVVAVFARSTGEPAPGTRFAAALSGTRLAPSAHGTASMVRTDAGWHIVLRATGLPRIDDGRYYEAWLKGAHGTLVPIGTFNQPNDVTLWAGVSPVNFPGFTVTIERADNDQTSSGRRVLTGTARPAV
jgi:hypothetical protein